MSLKTNAIIILFLLIAGCNLSITGTDPGENVPFGEYDSVVTIGSATLNGDTLLNRAIVGSPNTWRLHRFFHKCSTLDEVRIGFIGGSVTYGAHASPFSNRYSSRFCRSLQDLFPNNDIKEINAGIGATRSRYGCSRITNDVLKHNPDMVVIEFAINDYGIADSIILGSVEGMVQQCLEYNEDILVVMLFMMVEKIYASSQDLHGQIGQHYRLPMVSFKDACKPEIEQGVFTWEDIGADVVHPNNTGHRLASYLLFGSLIKLLNNSTQGTPFPIPTPVVTDFYEQASYYGGTEENIITIANASGWTRIPEHKGRIGYESEQQGASLELLVRSRELSIGYYSNKVDSGRVAISIDGGEPLYVSNVLSPSWGDHVQVMELFKAEEKRERKIRIENINGNHFSIDYFLFAGY